MKSDVKRLKEINNSLNLREKINSLLDHLKNVGFYYYKRSHLLIDYGYLNVLQTKHSKLSHWKILKLIEKLKKIREKCNLIAKYDPNDKESIKNNEDFLSRLSSLNENQKDLLNDIMECCNYK